MTLTTEIALLSLTVALVVVFLVYAYLREKRIRDLAASNTSLQEQLAKKQTRAFTMGISQTKGDIVQVLGTLSALNEYETIIFLSTASKQGPLDLLGVGTDSLDFVEIKKKGADLTTNEKSVKRLVDEKKVRYRILDVEIPDSIKVDERFTNTTRRS